MKKACSKCGTIGQLGNSILLYRDGRRKYHLCWECSATPCEKAIRKRAANAARLKAALNSTENRVGPQEPIPLWRAGPAKQGVEL